MFDTGASHSCISKSMVEMLDLIVLHLSKPLCVKSPLGVSEEVCMFCDTCPFLIGGRNFSADLIVIGDNTFDVILGVDWLSSNHALINC